MNIYLDINGTILLGPHKAASFADDFIQFVVSHWPDSTYWLSTYAWQGEDSVAGILKPLLKKETISYARKIKAAKWHEWKTDGIDFGQPFLWFDDNLYPEEKRVLETFNALDSWIGVDLVNDPNQLIDEVARLKALV